MMTPNPILDKIHAIRQKLLADYNGDIHAYVEAARKRALESARRIVEPSQRTSNGPSRDGLTSRKEREVH